MTAKEIMTTPALTAGPETPLETIVELMLTHRISGVPIVDSEDRLLGIVTESDLIEEERRTQHLPRLSLFGLALVREGTVKDAYLASHQFIAREVMTKKVFTVHPDTPVTEIAGLLVQERINRVPVVAEGKVVGIISRADLVRALHRSALL